MKRLWRIFLAWIIHYDFETICPACLTEDALHVSITNWDDCYVDRDGEFWWWEGDCRCCKCGLVGKHSIS